MKKLLPGGGNQLVNYSYNDIADGSAVQVFYGLNHVELTASSYALVSQNMFSNDIETQSANVTNLSPAQKWLDLDFDTMFNLPKRIRGKARASFTFGVKIATNDQLYAYSVVRLRKVTGGVESEIANATSETVSRINTAGQTPDTVNLEITIPSVVHFKKGDILRATVEIWAYYAANATGTYVCMCHDPQDRASAFFVTASFIPDTRIFQLNIPFLTDI